MDEDYYESDSGNTAVQNYDRTAIPDPSQPSGYRNDVAPQLNAYQAWNPQAPQLNIPSGEVDWDYVNRAVSAHRQSEALQMQRKTYEAKINQAAVRERGRLKMQQLIEGGATPQEAYRLAMGELHFQDPEAQVAAMFRLQPTGEPQLHEIDGVDFIKHPDGRYTPYTPPAVPKPPKPAPFKPDPVDLKLAETELSDAKKDLDKIRETGTELSTQKRAKAQSRFDSSVANLRKAYNPPESNFKPVMGDFRRNVEDPMVLVVNKDGKRGHIPRINLEKAIKSGYKIAE